MFPFAESILSGVITGDRIRMSIPGYYDHWNSNADIFLESTSLALSIALNAVTTMMIAYKLWYVPAGGIHRIQWLTMK